jgi:phosphate uptake regulator
METRKVQRTGKSTFIVSLPKVWAVKNGVQAGSLIYINQSDNGALVLSPERSEQDLEVKLDISDKNGEPLIRDIIGCYVSGYRTMEVTSGHMSSSQKKDIHQIVQKLIGPEILEETVNKLVIQDLLNSEELQAEKALKRIRTIVRSMIQDSIEALVTYDKELAEDVIQRDDDVDRLYLLISRQFTEILRSGSIKQEMLDPITAFNYMQAAYNLERMADHASRIAEMVASCDCPFPEELVNEVCRMDALFVGLIDEAVSSLLQLNTDKANEIIDQSRKIRNQGPVLPNASEMTERGEIKMRLVISSIERMLDYIKNIGELTINLRQASVGNGMD